MPPTVAEFRTLLEGTPLGAIVDTHVLAGESFFFTRTPKARTVLEDHLGAELGLGPDQIRLVGSGHVGYSISPDGFPATFSAASDLDIVVVNADLFDTLWKAILRWHYGVPGKRLPDASWESAKRVYWGWIAPDLLDVSGLARSAQLQTVIEHRTRWFNAFQGLSRNRIFGAHSVQGRLYRTWDHARLYHIDSLRTLKDAVFPRH